MKYISLMTESEKAAEYERLTGKKLIPEPSARRKMQDVYGMDIKHTCGQCKHLVEREYSNTYFKCALWVMSKSSATDIRKGQAACRRFEQAEKGREA